MKLRCNAQEFKILRCDVQEFKMKRRCNVQEIKMKLIYNLQEFKILNTTATYENFCKIQLNFAESGNPQYPNIKISPSAIT